MSDADTLWLLNRFHSRFQEDIEPTVQDLFELVLELNGYTIIRVVGSSEVIKVTNNE